MIMIILIMFILILYRSFHTLYQWLLQMEQDDSRWCNVTKQVMYKSLAGNDVFLLTITKGNTSEGEMQQKKGVVQTAKVHPV